MHSNIIFILLLLSFVIKYFVESKQIYMLILKNYNFIVYHLLDSNKNYELKIIQKYLEKYHKYINKINEIHNDFTFTHSDDESNNHRLKCFVNNQILKNIIIEEFGDVNNYKETVLIEFRPLPNLEFLIRNTIIKLRDWNHTVVCGNINYNFIKNICNDLCKNLNSEIKIVKIDKDNLTPSEYSELLTTKSFWNNFLGEKILIYQDDTMLFHNSIQEFLKYDYIGAPWPEKQDDNSYGVGNGGFSLRSKSVMIKCLEKITPSNLKLGNSTLQFIKNTNLTFVPEDVYFSKTMIDYNVGLVAKRNIAKKFSQECIKSENPLGGHNFFKFNEENSKKYMNIFSLGTDYYKTVNHRSGWNELIKNLIEKNIVIEESFNDIILIDNVESFNDIILIDNVENFFLWESKFSIRNWIGIVHFIDKHPYYEKNRLLEGVFENMKGNLYNCMGLIVLSEYSKIEIKDYLKNTNYDIPIYKLKHPLGKINKEFNLEKFKNNKNLKIIQLGQQYRKISTIYTIKSNKQKIWLHGFKNIDINNFIKRELNYLKINKNSINKVDTLFINSEEQFDNLLLNNIIIIPLWNASANNSVLECIEMNIPAFITKLPATEEYLGEKYPMFYEEISEIEKIIDNNDLLFKLYEETYNYLLKMDKKEFSFDYFNSELLKIIN